MSSIVDDDDVIVPAPDPEVFAPHAPPAPTQIATGPTGIRSLAFLIGIGLLRWLGGIDSIFADMSIALSATLCGTGAFLLLVAMLNMLQVRSELAAAAAKRDS